KEQPPPESLRHRDRARQDSLESVRRSLALGRAAEGAKLSGARDRRGRQVETGRGGSCRLSSEERLMSREVHSGPTDETQARGTPYSGDPAGGEGTAPQAQLDKLPLDDWHRSKGARMVPFAGYEMPVQYEGII